LFCISAVNKHLHFPLLRLHGSPEKQGFSENFHNGPKFCARFKWLLVRRLKANTIHPIFVLTQLLPSPIIQSQQVLAGCDTVGLILPKHHPWKTGDLRLQVDGEMLTLRGEHFCY
jgi:hypothetical protein